jgi:hypothetical protein
MNESSRATSARRATEISQRLFCVQWMPSSSQAPVNIVRISSLRFEKW